MSGWLVASAFQYTVGKPVNTPFEPIGDLVFLLAVTGTLVLPVIHAYLNEGVGGLLRVRSGYRVRAGME